MYETALLTTTRVFSQHRIVIASTSLLHTKPWFPPVWNISNIQLARKLTDIHSEHTWEVFAEKLKTGPRAHTADFRRIALLYLYGGTYSDIDGLWLRPPPDQFMVKTGPAISNGAIATQVPRHPWMRRTLAKMPGVYNPARWTGIGGNLLKKTLSAQERESFSSIPAEQMYTIGWKDARTCFYTQHCPKNASQVLGGLSYSLHLYGKMTSTANGALPVAHSMYDDVARALTRQSTLTASGHSN